MNELIYLYGDLVGSLVMMVCGGWLLTDQALGRLVRLCHACIAAGALVNVLGIVADQVGFKDISYGHIWPGEVMTDLGMAALMSVWVWRSLCHRRGQTPPFPSASA